MSSLPNSCNSTIYHFSYLGFGCRSINFSKIFNAHYTQLICDKLKPKNNMYVTWLEYNARYMLLAQLNLKID